MMGTGAPLASEALGLTSMMVGHILYLSLSTTAAVDVATARQADLV